MEGFTRNVTEMLWTAGARPASAGRVYYPVLALFVVGGRPRHDEWRIPSP